MGKGAIVGVLGVVMWLGASADAAAFSASYDQKMTQGRDVYTSTVAMKDGFFRMEMTMGGATSIILRNAQGTFTVMPDEGIAMKTPALQPGQEPVEGADNYGQYLQQRQAERIGSETIDGHACDVYRYTDPAAEGATTVWVWKDKMFPVRVEMDGPDGKMVTELSNIRLGAAIPDSAFALPDDVEVIDMGAMMGR